MLPNEFITSDTHFGHKLMCRSEHRTFADAKTMDEAMIAAWNRKVPPGATVHHLGDFSFRNAAETREIVRRLNGRIRLVRGNHDRVIKGALLQLFEWVKDYHESKTEDGRKVVMCHYPMLTWNKSHYGSWMLHGHSHGTLGGPKTTRLDVGVDTHPQLEPWSFGEIQERMQGREYLVVDHHEGRGR